MDFRSLPIAVLAMLATVIPATASNEMILLNPDDLSSLATIDVTGSFNRLMIEQVTPANSATNSVRVAIVGDRNGGPEGSSFTGIAGLNGLTPGQIIQRGFGNAVDIDVRGNDNLFAMSQIGNDNTVRGTIVGFGNQASISQAGNGNFASFSQNGMGNMISVRQIAW